MAFPFDPISKYFGANPKETKKKKNLSKKTMNDAFTVTEQVIRTDITTKKDVPVIKQ